MKRGQPNPETLLARISELEAENEHLKELPKKIYTELLEKIEFREMVDNVFLMRVSANDLEEIFTNNGIELEEKH